MNKFIFGGLILILALSVGLYYYREKAAAPDELAQVDEVIQSKDASENSEEKVIPESVEKVLVPKKEIGNQAKQNDKDDDLDDDASDDLAEDMGANGEGSGNPQNEKGLNEEDADKMTAYFEATEKAWNERMEHFIIDELHLSMKTVKEYKVLREGFDRDKMEAFEDFHKYMRDKHGDNYSYNPTKDEEKFVSKVRDQYDGKLRQLFGQQNYLQYREVLSEFNKQRKAEQNPEIGVLYMDL